MTYLLIDLGCILLCALTFRIRGGLLEGSPLPIPGQVCRLTFAIAAGLTAWTVVSWWIALATVPIWWVASTFPLFESIGLGADAGVSKSVRDPRGRSARWWFWRDFGMLALRGLLWTVGPAAVLWWPHTTLDPVVMIWTQGAAHWWVLLIAGLSMPACYWVGRQSGCRLPGLGARDYCQTAEGIYGVVLGLGIIAAGQ